jgi:hypothetical protein
MRAFVGFCSNGYLPQFEGAVFSDGSVAVHWLTEIRSHSIWSSLEDFFADHRHPEYGTIMIKWASLQYSSELVAA